PDVGETCDGGNCLLLPATANQDRDLSQRWRYQLGQPVLDALERIYEHRMARRHRAEVVAVFGVVRLVPTRAEAEDEATVADVVDGAGHIREQVRVAEPRSPDQKPELGAAGDLGPR